MYFEFLLRRAHSRNRVERTYWSGVNLNSFTTCSNEVTVGTTGPIGSGLPQLGFPRRFAIDPLTSSKISYIQFRESGPNIDSLADWKNPKAFILRIFSPKINTNLGYFLFPFSLD